MVKKKREVFHSNQKKSNLSIKSKIVFVSQFVEYHVKKSFQRYKMKIVALFLDILKDYISRFKAKLNKLNPKLLYILKELITVIKSNKMSGYQLVQHFLQMNDIARDLTCNFCGEIIKKIAFGSGSFHGLQLLRSQTLKSGYASTLCGCYYSLKKNHQAGLGEFFIARHSFLTNILNKQEVKVNKTKRNRFELSERMKSNLFDEQPLIFLCIGTFFMNWSLSLSERNRSKLALNGIAWFGQYFNYRKCTNLNEVYYNIGRCAHAYGIYNLAAEYYYCSIQAYYLKEKISKEKKDIHFYKNDLSRECAFNLIHIYKQNQNNSLMILLLKMYLKI